MSEERLFKTYERELKEFEDWIKENPRLPKNINKLLLLRFLKVYDFDIEKAKKLLITFFETRKKYPQLFQNRDVLSEEFQTIMSLVQFMSLRKPTKDNHKVTIFRISNPDATKYSYVSALRLAIAMLDSRFIYCDENELIDGEITLVDVSNFTFKHFTKIVSNIGTMKAYLAYSQEAAPIKIIKSHFVKCSPLASKLMSIIKPLLSKEVRDSFVFHSSLEELHEHIPKDILPVEFGGTEEPLDEYYKKIKEFLEKNRDYLLCDDNWKIED